MTPSARNSKVCDSGVVLIVKVAKGEENSVIVKSQKCWEFGQIESRRETSGIDE